MRRSELFPLASLVLVVGLVVVGFLLLASIYI